MANEIVGFGGLNFFFLVMLSGLRFRVQDLGLNVQGLEFKMCSKIWQVFENFSSSMEIIETDHYFPCLSRYGVLCRRGNSGCLHQMAQAVAHRISWYLTFQMRPLENPWAMAQRPFVHSVNSIWTKRMDHVHFLIKKNLLNCFLEMWLP